MFVGCFDKRAKVRLLPSDIYSTGDGSLEYFNYLQNLRDSYAAHKFGALRQCSIVVKVDENGNVLNVFYNRQVFGGPQAGRNDLLEVVRMAHRYTESKVHSLGMQVYAYAKALTPDQIAALKPPSMRPVPVHEIRLSRTKFANKSGP
jgi:hypothetical protein